MVIPLVKFQCWKGKIYFTYTSNFSIKIYDQNGKLLDEIKKEIPKNRITERDKTRLKNLLFRKAELRNKRHLKLFKRLKYTFPEYFPDIQDFIVNNNKIFSRRNALLSNRENMKSVFRDGEPATITLLE